MNQNATINIAPSRPAAPRKRVLLPRGGFAGMNAARRLGQTLGKQQDIDVVLISRENAHEVRLESRTHIVQANT